MIEPVGWGRGSAAISATALFTSHVWTAAGLGDSALESPVARLAGRVGSVRGRILDELGMVRVESFLLARHQLIDHLLVDAVEAGRVGAVVELAAGLSPRGMRMTRRFPTLDYVEVDLPAMAQRKRERLRRSGPAGARVRVVAADVFEGPLDAVFANVADTVGVAVLTEGLVNYFPTEQVLDLWSRLVADTDRFPSVLYLSDLHLDGSAGRIDRLVGAGVGAAVHGTVHFHFADEAAAEAAVVACGFSRATVHLPSTYAGLLPDTGRKGADRVRVLSATRP